MRNVLVTGGSRGLGLACAERLAADGFRVLAMARRGGEALERASAAAEGGPGAIRFVPFDLDALDAVAGTVRELCQEHGPLYGLVNNAGIGTEGVLATMPLDAMERLVRLNTLAPMVVAKHAIRPMMSAGAGRVINMSSVIASTGYSGLSVYAATKASMLGFTRSLAREVGALGITVNAVAPGFTPTEMTAGMDAGAVARIAKRSALKRLPTAADVAAAVSFLMGDGAANITGTVLTVDAGNTA